MGPMFSFVLALSFAGGLSSSSLPAARIKKRVTKHQEVHKGRRKSRKQFARGEFFLLLCCAKPRKIKTFQLNFPPSQLICGLPCFPFALVLARALREKS